MDTNVLSELRRGDRINVGLLAWFEAVEENDLFVSVMTLGEIRKGIERLRPRDPAQAQVLDVWLQRLERRYRDRILPVCHGIAESWGRLEAIRPVPTVDALLAATALEHDLVLVTRNERDFQDLGVSVLNPFSDSIS